LRRDKRSDQITHIKAFTQRRSAYAGVSRISRADIIDVDSLAEKEKLINKREYNVNPSQLRAICSKFEDIYKETVAWESIDMEKYDNWFVGLPKEGMALVEDSLNAYYETIELMLRITWVAEFLSPDFLKNELNDIIRKEYQNFVHGKLDSMAAIERFVRGLERFIEPWAVIVPVTGIHMSGIEQLTIGNVAFQKLGPDDPILRKAKKAASADEALLKEYVDPMQGRLVAILHERGEPERAREKAVSSVDEALDVLRFYSTFLFEARESRINLGLRARIELWNSLSVQLKKEKLFLFKTPKEIPPLEFRINETVMRILRENRFPIVDEILKRTNRTEIEEQILNAIKWFGLARQMDDEAMSFVAYYTALDMLVSERRNDPPEWSTSLGERIAESVAFLLGRNLEHRRRIKAYQKQLWALRSKIVHAGVWLEENKARLSGIRETVKEIIVTLLARTGEFQTKDQLQQWVESQRMSRPAQSPN
jgi:hypothetical protein